MALVKLGNKAVGSIVKLNVNGTARNFIVVSQGKPGTVYDDSCDGVWLLMQDCYTKMKFGSNNNYKNSEIPSYLNGDFLGLFDASIQAQIKQVEISMGVNSTLSAKIFLLSATEIGNTATYHSTQGACLAYFNKGGAKSTELIAHLDGSAIEWWTRTAANVLSGTSEASKYVIEVTKDGGYGYSGCGYVYGIRPALVLPASILVSDDGSVTANTAPTMPASISIPNSVEGRKSIEVSWSAATDKENNLEGYIVERSVDGGGTWTQVYQGGATQTTNTVPVGSETVIYRVKAYDSEGLCSIYRSSGQVIVFNNNAPGAPSGITVPENVLGGTSLTVTWNAASDVDDNLAGYELERQVDGGEWTQVYKGEDTSYTDDITRGWASVNYRVRAYDAYDATSAYTTGMARPVSNNRAPAFTCDKASGADLGKKNTDFDLTYSVGDEDGDPVTVTEAIDGVTLRTFSVNLGGNNIFAVTGNTFFKLLNGAHVLTISATDGQAAAVHKLNFTKEVTAATITLTEPMEADDKISICVLSVACDIPADAEYQVEVTNNALDDEPVWEDCTAEVKNGGNHIFTNENAINGFAFNFRVSAERGPSGQGGYITSVQGGFQ